MTSINCPLTKENIMDGTSFIEVNGILYGSSKKGKIVALPIFIKIWPTRMRAEYIGVPKTVTFTHFEMEVGGFQAIVKFDDPCTVYKFENFSFGCN
jgi:hypothetical protein